MALYVNTNVTSLRGQSSLNKASNALSTTYNRLSTGLRINSAWMTPPDCRSPIV